MLLLATSLARTSGGGITFLNGLTAALAQETRLTLVLPHGHGTRLARNHDVVRVRPLVGFARVARDLAMVDRWARRTRSEVVVIPHEWAAHVSGARVVNVVQNVLFFTPEGYQSARLKSMLMRMLARSTGRYASRTIAVSPLAARLWAETAGLPSILLPEGVSRPPQNVRLEPRDGVLIITGAAEYKNPSLANELRDRLVQEGGSGLITVLGGGSGEGRGWVGHDWLDSMQILAEMYRARVVVVTSKLESFGLPAFEAHAAGANVVVLRDTPMAYWLADHRGVHVAEPDINSLVASTLNALTRPSELPTCDEFGWDRVGPAWCAALTDTERVTSSGGRS